MNILLTFSQGIIGMRHGSIIHQEIYNPAGMPPAPVIFIGADFQS
jgi:hypothetical protein